MVIVGNLDLLLTKKEKRLITSQLCREFLQILVKQRAFCIRKNFLLCLTKLSFSNWELETSVNVSFFLFKFEKKELGVQNY